jgi:DNA modification methylase
VLCGDALKVESYAQVLDGGLASVVFTDPPFNVKIKGNVSGLGKIKHDEFAMASGEMDDAEFGSFLETFLAHSRNHCIPNAVLFAFMDWRHFSDLDWAGRSAGLKLINMAVWNKGAGGMGLFYRSAHELVAVFCNGAVPAINNVTLGVNGRDRTNVWNYAGANRRGSSASKALASRPTPKSVDLVVDSFNPARHAW